ncbi:serine/threonine-protein kinase [Pseudonocardia spinosispora]|uniref:serine/threonine-protein kinase n=1 Tax=Pseudonocardia spinosispora TaxID=103441 RepID=UPI0003FA5AFE|nr:serine/threonine-protein kinase [Pseudonocardia spinosispora]
MALHEGDQIAERYRLTKQIAVGGMGEVWESADLRLGRTVAIKVLKPEIGSDPDFLARFRTEAQIAASINHRGIAGVHDYGEGVTPDGTPTAYLVMELVRGEPLSARIASRGKLGTVLTLDLLEQAGRGLYAAHSRGFVHRDVKPGNILLADDGTVKLTDFGIAKAASAAPVTESGMVMGTAHYIAPEQARGDEASPASDVYSLAVVGYECLTGHRPFQAASPVDVAMMHINDPLPPLPKDIPENVRALIENTLVKEPGQRYKNGGDFAAAVAAVRRGLPPPNPDSVVVQSTSGALPAVGSLLTDRIESSSDGLAIAGLAAPGMPPLPGKGSGRSGLRKRGKSANKGQSAATGTGHQTITASGPRAVSTSGGYPQAGPYSPTGATAGPPRQFAPLPSPTRSGRIALFVTFVLLTIAAVAIGVYVVRNAVSTDGQGVGRTHPTVRSSVPAPGTPPAGSVLVDPGAYTGKPATTAIAGLQTSGLNPTLHSTTGAPPADPAACTVTDLSPNGQQPPGTVVTITCTPR